jgi:preprotein translocase subunit YajC
MTGMLHPLTNHAVVAALFAGDAPAPAGPATNPQADLLKMALPLILMFVIFYVLLIRPQQKKAREHQTLLGALKPRDKVVTSAGMCGEVISIKDKTVTLRCGESKLEVLKSSIAEVVERPSGATEPKS